MDRHKGRYVPMQKQMLGAPLKDDNQNLEDSLLKEVNTAYLLQPLQHATVPTYQSADVFFNNFADAKEGDGFFAFKPSNCIGLQSANGKTDWSLGLARDVPFRFGEVLAFLQVQIVNSPVYNVLIGRPFKVLMKQTFRTLLWETNT
ncbi:hypothetical protein GGU10DRAFT_337029 [Lentinula aff. detonsa]|uniref:Uncharacterized protein n=1 Tax=Lentinula aff. detonsa TaxID=2804958 RepID=A0AA38L1V0_9AGAR|nr:hypothetical protein GGU10DRAFT_337029 [Lentinula aff. detonsa]